MILAARFVYPAAFCGVTGFKPSQFTVSLEGALPLSQSLDSVGPIAKSVTDCELAWQVLSGQHDLAQASAQEHIIVPTNFGLDDADSEVKTAFEAFLSQLKAIPGMKVEEKPLAFFSTYKELPIWQFSAVESSRYYQEGLGVSLDELDPRSLRVWLAHNTSVKKSLP